MIGGDTAGGNTAKNLPSSSGGIDPAAGALLPLTEHLNGRLQRLAELRGCGAELLGRELLLQALDQAEALPSGRCSTRLGQCSVGPVPLPFQQP